MKSLSPSAPADEDFNVAVKNAIARRQIEDFRAGRLIACAKCRNMFRDILRFYRCRYCGVFYCGPCADEHFRSNVDGATVSIVRPPFVARMETELAANAHKGDWREWRPSPIEVTQELNYHFTKLVFAMAEQNRPKVSEFAADVANIAMKADEVLGE